MIPVSLRNAPYRLELSKPRFFERHTCQLFPIENANLQLTPFAMRPYQSKRLGSYSPDLPPAELLFEFRVRPFSRPKSPFPRLNFCNWYFDGNISCRTSQIAGRYRACIRCPKASSTCYTTHFAPYLSLPGSKTGQGSSSRSEGY